jgi:phage terminase large subunit
MTKATQAELILRAAAELEWRRRVAERMPRIDGKPSLPAWAKAFSAKSRYKVAYGGRGSGKSWAFARMLLLEAARRPIRVLCARELQISIKDSVHRLLSDQVDALGLSSTFDVGQSFLRGVNGSDFIFKGLRHNATEIKSTEAIDICWVEEAQAVSDESWRLLIPTIRSPGSEIWATFNPDQESDPTYQRFVVNPPPGAIVRRVNYNDNPFFPAELEAERAYLENVDPDAHAHVWLGECRSYSDAQVLANKWRVEAFEPQTGWDGPYYGADWGFAKDPTALVRAWVDGRDLYIEHEAWGVEVELDHTPALFDSVPDAQAHIIRADSARPETIRHLQKHGYENVSPAKKWPGSVQDGVEFLRSFERIVIHPRCKHTLDEARLWSFKTDRLTGDVLPALVDAHNHCWDAIRYALNPLIRARKASLYLPDVPDTKAPGEIGAVLASLPQPEPGSCGRCLSYREGICQERGLRVGAKDVACDVYLGRA